MSIGKYQPAPVKRVEIPKDSGGTRQLGIPIVLDRLIQQAIAQVLTPVFDPHFSESSFGFRPGRSAHQAVRKVLKDIREGYRYAVDIDLEKFFDTVEHDVLMSPESFRDGSRTRVSFALSEDTSVAELWSTEG
jgi:RNA-directed DNA polymerase